MHMYDMNANSSSVLYKYFIKYDKLDELLQKAYNTSTNHINIYIDLYDMMKPLYSVNIEASHKLSITSAIMNIAAHYRAYFRKYYNINTRIYLIYADGSNSTHTKYIREFRDCSIINTINYYKINPIVVSQLELVKMLCAYTEDIYFIKRGVTFPVEAYNIISNNGKNTTNMIITRDKLAYQMCSYNDSTALFRPTKYNGSDTSTAANKITVLHEFYKKATSDKTHKYLDKINPELLGLLTSVTGIKSYNLKALTSCSVIAQNLYSQLDYTIINAYNADTQNLYKNLIVSKYIDYITFDNRFKACDLNHQLLIYRTMVESRDISWNVNFYNPQNIMEINDKYFYGNPIDIFGLVQ